MWRINQSTAGTVTGSKKDSEPGRNFELRLDRNRKSSLSFRNFAMPLSKDAMKKIGILDIYGFEVFDWNSFELPGHNPEVQ